MGVFGKLSGLFGSNKSKRPAPPVPAGSPVGGAARSTFTPPTPNKPTPASTESNGSAAWSNSSTATLEPKASRVVIDLTDEQGEQASATDRTVRISRQDSDDMLGDLSGDVPPPPPAFRANVPTAERDDSLDPVRTPKNRQELIEELQKNYAEVVTLVRKMDGHLDRQDKRSVRLLEIAETLPTAIEDLSAIRQQHSKLAEAIDSLTAATKQSSSSNEAAQSMQIKALGEVRSLMEQSEGHERRVAESLDEFKASIGEVATSTGRLGGVLEGMDSRQARRENELRQAIVSGQKWMTTAVVLGLVCLGIVVIVGVLAFA